MKRPYQIHTHPDGNVQAIKAGFSWPAFFFGWIWCLVKRLYLQAVVLFFIWVAVGVGDYFRPEGSVMYACVGILAAIFVGLKGNTWLARRAEFGGYEFRGLVPSDSPKAAIGVFKRAGSETETSRSIVTGRFRDLGPHGLRPLLAIVKLTWKAALRYRLFITVATLLVGSVVLLPLLIKDDGTARGFSQILLTYTLSIITLLLGFATLWLSCGLLAGDIEDCQMQMVAVKPIPRWQVWLGKWIGIVSLNAALLAVSGSAVYGLLMYRADRLPEKEREKLASEILVARGSLKEESHVGDINEAVDKYLADKVKDVNTNGMDFTYERAVLEQKARAQMEQVPPQGGYRTWKIPVNPVSSALDQDVFQLRFHFYGADTNSLKEHVGVWVVGYGQNAIRSRALPMAANSFHEVPVHVSYLGEGKKLRDLLDNKGELIVQYHNVDNSVVVFPLEDGLEVLYHEGGFVMNYVRGLLIILFWLSLLAALGLAAASYMTFPVACFCSIGILIIVFSSGTLASTVSEGTVMGLNHDTGKPYMKSFDSVLLPMFRGMLYVIKLAQDFSPVDNLSSGRSIAWSRLGQAFLQIVALLGGIVGGVGIYLFHRRELATAQSNQ
ncbi:DUF2628 domain-containing protein [bacterium]|nr:DUF2628 domain-containing protein [bacterium]